MPVKKITFTAGEIVRYTPEDPNVGAFIVIGDKVLDKNHNPIPSVKTSVPLAKEEIEFLISLAYEGANLLKGADSFRILKLIRQLETESLKELTDITMAEEDLALISKVYGQLDRRNVAFIRDHIDFILQLEK